MKICIDSGHYKNYNKGAVSSYFEGNIMWKLTNLQKKYLEEYKDVTVTLTRSDIAKDLDLSSRGKKAKGHDLFISNHSNATTSETTDRAVIIYPFDDKNNSSVLGKKIGKAITDTMGLKQSYQMYQRKNSSGGEYYGVMRSARSVNCPRYYILEHGFHTNKNVCNWLLKDANLEKLAKAEVKAIAEYYNLKKKETTTSNSATSDAATSNTSWKNGDYNCKVKTKANLNLRSGRGTSYDIIHTIPKGTTLTVNYCLDNWFSTYDFGTLGYLCGDYIELV